MRYSVGSVYRHFLLYVYKTWSLASLYLRTYACMCLHCSHIKLECWTLCLICNLIYVQTLQCNQLKLNKLVENVVELMSGRSRYLLWLRLLLWLACEYNIIIDGHCRYGFACHFTCRCRLRHRSLNHYNDIVVPMRFIVNLRMPCQHVCKYYVCM